MFGGLCSLFPDYYLCFSIIIHSHSIALLVFIVVVGVMVVRVVVQVVVMVVRSGDSRGDGS